MSAITGIYRAPNLMCRNLTTNWLHHSTEWSSPRHHLATQLVSIRKTFGTHEACEFRNYLLWLGVYPVRLRNHP